MPQKRTLLYIGLALGGYLAYRWYEKNKMTVTTSPGTVPVTPPNASTLINPTNIPSSGIIAPPATASSGSTILPTSSPSIDPGVVAVVQKWTTTDGRPPVLQFAAAMVPSEYAGMYDIITNQWDKNVPPTAAQTAFWDNLRTKYDPTHQYW